LGSEGSESIVLSDARHGAYKKLVIAQGRLIGAVLVGDTADALWYSRTDPDAAPTAKIRADMMFGRSLSLSKAAA